MKRFTTIDVITILGILSCLVLMLGASGCGHGFYLQGHRVAKIDDPRECCKRLSLHHEEMSKFNRYCKVALFLSKSKSPAVGNGVKESAGKAVGICKFVFNVETDQELIAAGDEQEYYRVQSYIVPEDHVDSNGWLKKLDCDPAEPTCEEF